MAWNQTKTEFPSDKCIHQLFEIQAEHTPNAIAVVCKDRRLTYRQLNEHANKVAHGLRSLGVGPETLVAICVERSLEMAIGLLAILKAGGAYVPIDPSYPGDRLSVILSEARPAVLLTQRRLMFRFSEPPVPVVFLDRERCSAKAELKNNLAVRVTPDNLAYAIFTSGSTGKPKGVLIAHRSLVNHGTAMACYYNLRSEDRVLQFAALSFDVAAEEIFPTWLSGAAVVLWPVSSGAAPVRSFLDFVEEQEITILNLPAPYWQEWCFELERLRFPSTVRLVVVGSDKVSAENLSLWKKYVRQPVRWCNAYGPTEATITATVYEPGVNSQRSRTNCVPIGRPIANTETYVLDENLNLVPVGIPGELHIGGVGLARGYLNDQLLTEEKFIPNPFSNQKGELLYKTGDLARYLPDGNLEFLGRVDDQVKIRGYRIEIGDIETTLREYPRVRNAVVMSREDEPGAKKLAAYLVFDHDSRPSQDELKKFLRARLPDYMVPAAFVLLKRLPLTPGGKVDRRQLPPPTITQGELRKNFVPPNTEVESKLVEIWEKMLGVRPIGIRDNFFEIGGHSLLEVRFVAEVEKNLGVTLPLTSLYYTRTIENLAKILEYKKKSGKGNSLLHPYRTKGSKPPIFSYGGSTHLAYYLGAEQPIYWFDFHGMNGLAMPATIEEMAAEYITEIRRIQPCGPYFLLGYSIGGLVMFEAAQQLLRHGEQIALLALIDPSPPSNLEHITKTSMFKHSLDYHQKGSGSSVILQKCRDILRRIRGRIRWTRRITKRAVCEGCLTLGYRLPPFLRLFYFDDRSTEVIKRYNAQVYPGSFLLFRRLDNSTESQWRRLATGELEIHETWVDHNEFLEEPYVQILAEKIKDHIERSQATASTTLGLEQASRPYTHPTNG